MPDMPSSLPHRRQRQDGWTPDRQRLFIETLAATASVTEAAQTAGMSVQSAYRLRNDPRADAFRSAWALALNAAVRRLQDIAFDRALRLGRDQPERRPHDHAWGCVRQELACGGQRAHRHLPHPGH